MRLRTKTTLYLALAAIFMVLLLVAAGTYLFNRLTLHSERLQAQATAELVRLLLVESMRQPGPERRERLQLALASVPELRDTRIVAAAAVTRQHGQTFLTPADASPAELRVLAGGAPEFAIAAGGEAFSAVLPFAASEGACLGCHQARAGEVLGVFSLSLPLAAQQSFNRNTQILVTSVVALFALVAIGFFARLMRPVETAADEIHEAVQRAKEGDFTAIVRAQSDDEIGQIAAATDSLLRYLHTHLAEIHGKVAELVRFGHAPGSNLLLTTATMVGELADAAHFKQSIEEDESPQEVYSRLSRILEERFGLARYSIYELAASRDRLRAVLVDGEPGGECRWCEPQILARAAACRAMRTGHIVSSLADPGICPMFRPGAEGGQEHLCLPLIQGGATGGVLQLVIARDEAALVERLAPYIALYLREASPVLEARRLLDTVREASLRDPMTGLHNRRYLEDYVEPLVSYCERHDKRFSVLMADMDFFKQVNDTHGHAAGDKVLKALAGALRQNVRASDLVVRYGGEEFLLVLRDTSAGAGDLAAEKLRKAVEDMVIEAGAGVQLRKTLSIGVADFPDDSRTFWQVVKYADVALYKAKEAGRNRVLHFKPEMWPQEGGAY